MVWTSIIKTFFLVVIIILGVHLLVCTPKMPPVRGDIDVIAICGAAMAILHLSILEKMNKQD